MLAQLIAFIAQQQPDPSQVAADLRAACLRSLAHSMSVSNGSAEAKDEVSGYARAAIEDTFDTIGPLMA